MANEHLAHEDLAHEDLANENPAEVRSPRHQQIVTELVNRWPESRPVPSLGRIEALCTLLADPQDASTVIQITGTNGKGSTAIIIDALLRALGLRTGRFASPHLSDVTERICLDGAPVSPELFDDQWEQIKPLVQLVDAEQLDGVAMTFFEVITGLAYATFADAPVDVAVMEVGMGGLWDATSVAKPKVSVVAPIALDHTHILGSTISQIAREKAGIIKPGSVAVLADQDPAAQRVLVERCLAMGVPMLAEGKDFGLIDRRLAVGGQVIRLNTMAGPVGDLFLPLHGDYMARNAALAVAAVEALIGRPIDPELIQDGFDNVVAPGRLEVVHRDPTVLVDTCHNPHGAAATMAAVAESFGFNPLIGVVAMMGDKDVEQVLEIFETGMNTLVATRASSTDRGLPVDELADLAEDVFGPERVERADTVAQALRIAVGLAEQAGKEAGVLVAGSVYSAGEARDLLLAWDFEGE